MRIVFLLSAGLALGGAASAQPLQVFVHYDYMVLADQGTACEAATDCDAGQQCLDQVCRGHSHAPDPKAINAVVEAFARQGIRLHVDPVHNEIPERHVVTAPLLWNPACAGDDAVTLDALRATYLRSGNPKLHYGVFGHRAICPDFAHCSRCAGDALCGGLPEPTASGFAELPGDNFAVTFGAFVDAGEPVPLAFEAATFMHELGHNLGLLHGGDQTCVNQKPNYVSVMNFTYQLNGIPVADSPGSVTLTTCTADADCGPGALCATGFEVPPFCTRIDYSARELAALNEGTPEPAIGGLDESVGVSGDAADTDLILYWAPGPVQLLGASNGGPIDWNGDGIIESHVQADVNNDTSFTLLTGFDDWGYLKEALAKRRDRPTSRRIALEPPASAPRRGRQ